MRKMLIKLALAALSSIVVLTGCTSQPEKKADVQRSLKVMFFDERYFFTQFGDLFSMQYPDVDVEVVSTQSIYSDYDGEAFDYNKAMEDFIEKEQPDVVMVSNDMYEKMAHDNRLVDLDALIERDKYDIETIYPALTEMLKEKGGGTLYGLSPTFYGSAVFYNADLFNKHGVELPHDGMTWQEILDLARRFPTDGDTETRIYGYGNNYSTDFSNLVSQISRSEGLTEINPDTMKVTVDTDSWKRVYKLALDAYDAKAIYSVEGDEGFMGGSMEEYYKSQLFMMGRIAITVGDPYMLQNLKEVKSSLKDYTPFELGIVAGPVDPTEPESTRDIYFGEIFGIRAGSPNADAAWDFIKFISGEDFARVKSRTMNNGLLSRMGFNKEFDGHSLDVFYKLKPKLGADNYDRLSKIPTDFYNAYYPLVHRETELIVKKEKSIDEALKTIQSEGQAALDQAILDQKNKEQNGSAEGTVEDSEATGASDGGAGISVDVADEAVVE